jgi:hypothetical protein
MPEVEVGVGSQLQEQKRADSGDANSLSEAWRSNRKTLQQNLPIKHHNHATKLYERNYELCHLGWIPTNTV